MDCTTCHTAPLRSRLFCIPFANFFKPEIVHTFSSVSNSYDSLPTCYWWRLVALNSQRIKFDLVLVWDHTIHTWDTIYSTLFRKQLLHTLTHTHPHTLKNNNNNNNKKYKTHTQKQKTTTTKRNNSQVLKWQWTHLWRLLTFKQNNLKSEIGV